MCNFYYKIIIYVYICSLYSCLQHKNYSSLGIWIYYIPCMYLLSCRKLFVWLSHCMLRLLLQTCFLNKVLITQVFHHRFFNYQSTVSLISSNWYRPWRSHMNKPRVNKMLFDSCLLFDKVEDSQMQVTSACSNLRPKQKIMCVMYQEYQNRLKTSYLEKKTCTMELLILVRFPLFCHFRISARLWPRPLSGCVTPVWFIAQRVWSTGAVLWNLPSPT